MYPIRAWGGEEGSQDVKLNYESVYGNSLVRTSCLSNHFWRVWDGCGRTHAWPWMHLSDQYWPEIKTLAFIGIAQRQRATPHWHTRLTLKHMQHSGQHLACLWHFIEDE
jgi:hypothetical protein